MSGLEGMVSLRPPMRAEQAGSLRSLVDATWEETLRTNPGAAIFRQKELESAYLTDAQTDAAGARARLTSEGLEGRLEIPDQGIPTAALDLLIQRKRAEIKTQEAFARAPTGVVATSVRLGVALAGSLMDPLNIASGFVPVVGEARYAQLLGKGAGVLRRTAARAATGAVEGAVGTAALEPFIMSSKALDQADYTMADSLLNIAFGGAFGAGLHTIGGATGDLWKYARGSAGEVAARVQPETRAAVLKTAIAQAANGERVNVEPVVKVDPRSEPDPFAVPKTFDEKIKAPYYREQLSYMRAETGWLEEGGKIMREGTQDPRGMVGEGQGEVIGRTPWLPRAEWWPSRPHGLSELEVHVAIDKALAGDKLGKRQQDVVDYLLDVADERKAIEPYAATPDELDVIGAGQSMDARMEVGLVARASEIDESAVERAAVQYDNDPDAFLQAIKEIVDRGSDAGRAAGEGAPQEAGQFDPTGERLANPQAQNLNSVRETAQSPKVSYLADERMSAAGDEQLADAPTDEVAALDEETADTLAMLKEYGIEPDERMEAADEMAADAKTYAKAARAAALCGFNHA
jgi:hypothetical protein